MSQPGQKTAIILAALVLGAAVAFLAALFVLRASGPGAGAADDSAGRGGQGVTPGRAEEPEGWAPREGSRGSIRIHASPGSVKRRFGNDLAAAVSNAVPDDTIAIGPGTYPFDTTLRPAANINLIGSGAEETVLVYHGRTVAVVVDRGPVMFQRLQLRGEGAAQLVNCDNDPAYFLDCRLDNATGFALVAEGSEVTAVSSEIVGSIDVSTAGLLKIKDTRYDRNRTRGRVEERNVGPRTGCVVDNWTFAEGGSGRWQAGAGWSITNGSAVWVGPAGGDGYLTQRVPMKPGRRYSLIWKASGSSGSFQERSLRVGGQSLDFTHTGDGVFTKKFTATAGDRLETYVESGPDEAAAMGLDFVYLEEIDDARPEATAGADRVWKQDAEMEKSR